jgi:hypothetical protein
MEDMKRGLDFEKAEAAFKRAAYKATHGTREERSGRFLPAEKPSSLAHDGGPKRLGQNRHKSAATRGR